MAKTKKRDESKAAATAASHGGGTDNRPGAEDAKAKLRRLLLDGVKPSHVLDVFCGKVGEMHQRVWCKADSYLGIDKQIDITREDRRRLVGNTQAILMDLDLEPFTIFDVDAYGAPWQTLLQIGRRKRWQPGQIYGMAITDGGAQKLRFSSQRPHSVCELLNLGAPRFTYRGLHQSVETHRRCIARWMKLSRVQPCGQWLYVSLSGGGNSLVMICSAVLFTPIATAARATARRGARPSEGSGTRARSGRRARSPSQS